MTARTRMAGLANPTGTSTSLPPVLIGSTTRCDVPAKAIAASRVLHGELFVGISDVNAMPSFLTSIVSDGDVWTFLGSNVAFSAGLRHPTSDL